MKLFGYEILKSGREKPGLPPFQHTPAAPPVVVSPMASTREELVNREVSVTQGGRKLPITAGRSSIPENLSTLGGLFGELALIDPDFPLKVLDVMEYLAKWNGDFSYAADNVVQLGNTEYTIEFDDEIPAALKVKMRKRIEMQQRQWYAHSGGLNSLINDLFMQVVVYGPLSAEIIPAQQLDGVERVVTVGVKNIRFIYDRVLDRYIPHQLVPIAGVFGNAFAAQGGTKALNEVTYKYIASRRLGEKPYAIPPFLAALESIVVEKEMMCNLKNIVRRIGLLGFLEVLVNAPLRRTDEPDTEAGDAAYFTRCQTYLDSVVSEVEKGTNKGYIVGFQNTHTFEMQGTNANVDGAEKLFKLNSEIKMAGLKQDPIMLGRNYNTTETLARVMITKLGLQVANYQKLVASFLEELFFMDLFLAGFPLTMVKVTFKRPILGDEHKDQQAEGQKITNVSNKYKMGIISQEQAAQELGYEEPDQEEPREPIVNPVDAANAESIASGTDLPKSTDTNKKKVQTIAEETDELEADLDGDVPVFPYEADSACGCTHSFAAGGDSDLEKFIRKYGNATRDTYNAATRKAALAVTNALSKLGNGASQQQVVDAVIYNLYKVWKKSFTTPQKKVIEKWIKTAYTFFRKDTKPFGHIKDIPDAVFDTIDLRAIQYFKNIDALYLGKFITDPDTKKAITEFIKKEYLENNTPIGSNTSVASGFKDKFAHMLNLEDWKIDRIITTTVNKMRNYAAVNYISQAEIEHFVVRGINDSLQCPYCASMQGKRFSVQIALEKVEDVVNSDGDHIKQVAPFITSVFRRPEDMANLSASQLQAAGIDVPPYHPSCRDIIVADI